MKTVIFLTHAVHFYRKPFHDRVRDSLSKSGVRYIVAQGAADQHDMSKKDTLQLSWSLVKSTRIIKIFGATIFWQPFLFDVLRADLVVIPQENKYVLNYILQLFRGRFVPKVALWGHGRNFQARNPTGLSERWKGFWATKASWWFGYTEETRAHLEGLGFPSERITIFNNSVDTSRLLEHLDEVALERLAALRTELKLAGKHVGIFVGGVYPDKRIQFLVKACDFIRAQIPDFELLVVGAGADLPFLRNLATTRPWINVTGPLFGLEKAEMMRLAHVFMMPGLMGLAILDAGVAGLPIVTTAFPWHSPEIAYLDNGVNGLKVENWESSEAYALAVIELLLDHVRRNKMGEAARDMAARFSIEAMADTFVEGVLEALES